MTIKNHSSFINYSQGRKDVRFYHFILLTCHIYYHNKVIMLSSDDCKWVDVSNTVTQVRPWVVCEHSLLRMLEHNPQSITKNWASPASSAHSHLTSKWRKYLKGGKGWCGDQRPIVVTCGEDDSLILGSSLWLTDLVNIVCCAGWSEQWSWCCAKKEE